MAAGADRVKARVLTADTTLRSKKKVREARYVANKRKGKVYDQVCAF
jgi:hypothetical protein